MTNLVSQIDLNENHTKIQNVENNNIIKINNNNVIIENNNINNDKNNDNLENDLKDNIDGLIFDLTDQNEKDNIIIKELNNNNNNNNNNNIPNINVIQRNIEITTI